MGSLISQTSSRFNYFLMKELIIFERERNCGKWRLFVGIKGKRCLSDYDKVLFLYFSKKLT